MNHLQNMQWARTLCPQHIQTTEKTWTHEAGMTQLHWALFTPRRDLFFFFSVGKSEGKGLNVGTEQFRQFYCFTHTHSQAREVLWCHSYLTLSCVPCTAFRSGDYLAPDGESVVACCVCLCLTDLPRPRDTRIPPHLWSPAISQPGSEEFLCNSHARPVFSKHHVSSPRVFLRGWPISVGSVKLFLL